MKPNIGNLARGDRIGLYNKSGVPRGCDERLLCAVEHRDPFGAFQLDARACSRSLGLTSMRPPPQGNTSMSTDRSTVCSTNRFVTYHWQAHNRRRGRRLS
jgi:hypothetical protein